MDEILGIRKKKKINSLSKTLKYILDDNLEIMFRNIKKALSIILTISATNASVESTPPFFLSKMTTGAQCQRIALTHLFCCVDIGT